MCICVLQSQLVTVPRFDLYSLSGLQSDGPSRLAWTHAKMRKEEPAKGGNNGMIPLL